MLAREYLKQLRSLYRARVSVVGKRNPYAAKTYAAQRLGYGLIGCGDMGYRDAAAIAGSANSVLAAVCDKEAALSEGLARQYGAVSYPNVHALLEDRAVGAVILALPNHLHAPFAVQALQAGKHVIVEKPMAITLQDCQAMMAAEQRSGRKLSVCFPQRYQLPWILARELVQSGDLGAVSGITILCRIYRDKAYWEGGFSGRAKSDWRTQKAGAGGGVLIMNAIHLLDSAMWIMGGNASSVQALMLNSTPGSKEVEDRVVMQFCFDKRALAILEATTFWPGTPVEAVEITGERGTIVVGQDLRLRASKRTRDFQAGRNYLITEHPRVNERTIFYNEFSDAVLKDLPPGVPSSEGFNVQKLVTEAYRTAGFS